MKRVRTFWDCDGCKAHGFIDFDAHVGVLEAVEAIDNAHFESASEFGRRCRVPVREIQVHIGRVQKRTPHAESRQRKGKKTA